MRMIGQHLRNVLLSVAALAGAAAFGPAAAADERQYCFSGLCLGDPVSILTPIALSDLGKLAARPRTKGWRATLDAALPRLGGDARATLASYTDADGSLLLDRRTLPIVQEIDRICAPMGTLISMFSSESGHPTAVEFQAIASEGAVRLGVTRLARSFQVKSGSSEERALLAELSEKFGFRVDDGAEQKLPPGRSGEVTASFVRLANGFRVSFARSSLGEGAAEFREQPDCGPSSRISID